jgi:hypothetical protein
VTPETALTAALADPTLAPTWAEHQVRFTVNLLPRLSRDRALVPSDTANLTSCSSPSSDTPTGCARPANTTLGCTNPAQLPAVITYNTESGQQNVDGVYPSSSLCNAGKVNDCIANFGGDSADWGGSASYCVFSGGVYRSYCMVGTSGNSWTASCPPTASCTGQYDAVPRLRACNNPGSCTKSQGTVTCTTYH